MSTLKAWKRYHGPSDEHILPNNPDFTKAGSDVYT